MGTRLAKPDKWQKSQGFFSGMSPNEAFVWHKAGHMRVCRNAEKPLIRNENGRLGACALARGAMAVLSRQGRSNGSKPNGATHMKKTRRLRGGSLNSFIQQCC